MATEGLRALCDQRQFPVLAEGLGSETGWPLSPGAVPSPSWGILATGDPISRVLGLLQLRATSPFLVPEIPP